MSENESPRNLLRYATAGLEFFLTFMMLLAGGWALDRFAFKVTYPGFTILGAIIGFVAGFIRITRQGWGILKSARELHEQQEKERREARRRRKHG